MEIEYVKCSNCKGTGRVSNNHGAGKWMTCPICKGAGKKRIHTNQKKSK